MNSIGIQIGNWVLHNGKPVQIGTIIPNAFILVIQPNGDWGTAAWSDISPIPLSPSILEAAGLKMEKNEYGECWRINEKFLVRKVNFNSANPEYGYAVEAWKDNTPLIAGIERCDHLHTLQNFCSLVGTELTITLP